MSFRPFSHGQEEVLKHKRDHERNISISVLAVTLTDTVSVIAKADIEIFLLFYICSGF